MARVLLIGATSAVAGACAELYAARGDELFLIARNADKLAEVAARLGDSVLGTTSADLTETERHPGVLAEAFETAGHFDIALLCHGLLPDQIQTEHDWGLAYETYAVNQLSYVSLLIDIANRFENRGRGRIGVITSVAGDRGRPRNYTYGSAKAALNAYLQGMRSRFYGSDITVTTLKLGPVDTPMTTHHDKNLVFTTAPRAGRDIVRAVDRGKAEAYVPWFWWWIMAIVRNMPEPIYQQFSFLSGR